MSIKSFKNALQVITLKIISNAIVSEKMLNVAILTK